MARVFLVLAFLLIPQGQACWSQEAIESAWIYMSEMDWQTPPPELQKTYAEADAQIVVLYPYGDFAYVSATVFRDNQTGLIRLCSGCGHSIRRGTWERVTNDTVRVRSKWVYRNLPPTKHQEFGEPTVVAWTITTDPYSGDVLSLTDGVAAYGQSDELANLKTLQALLSSASDEEVKR